MATISGKWVFNETPAMIGNDIYYVKFTSNGVSYEEIRGYSGSGLFYYSSKYTQVCKNDGTWMDDAYRYVDFGADEQTVSDEFYTWFTANAVGETAEEPEPEEPEVVQYIVRSDTLTAIADRTREMAGTNKKLTPADIIYWLGRVKFIPQGWATSEFTLDFDSGASGVLPVVVKGMASSEFTLNFESSAVGALQEG